MAPDLIIGIDAGTTACKLLAVGADGVIHASASADYPLHSPREGWAQQDARQVWEAVRLASRQIMGEVEPGRVAGVAFSGAMHSLMPVDDHGRPLLPAMTWADLRAVEQADALRADDPTGAIYQATGCPLRWPYWPAKLTWLKQHDPDIFRKATRFVGIKDWLIHQLTGQWCTDICMASATGLFDLRSKQWNEQVLSIAGGGAANGKSSTVLDPARLPALVEPQAIVGTITTAAAKLTGLPAGIAVIAGGGDGGLANIGAGGAAVGSIVATVGTSGAVRMTTSQPLLDPQQRTWCYVLTKDRYYAGGAINNGGLAVESIRRLFFGDGPKTAGFDALFSEAAAIGTGCDGVLLRPYFAGERSPHWRPDLRASIAGLTAAHSRGHVARAVLEGVAYCLADVWSALQLAGAPVPDGLRLTGGITRSRLWSQIVCDVLNLPVTLNEAGDASALGAAAMGHWGLGHIQSLEAFPMPQQDQVRLMPVAKDHAIHQERLREWRDPGTTDDIQGAKRLPSPDSLTT